jgi:hypothetical protein
MKLTPQRAAELRRRGVKVDMSKVVREPPPESQQPATKSQPAELTPEKPAAFDAVPHLLEIAKASEANAKAIIAQQSAVVEALREMTKPKPKKQYVSVVHRGKDGKISKVDTKEV